MKIFCNNLLLGNVPAARSGCIVLSTPENKLLVFGGYCKERIKKDFDKGQVHMDMFVLSPESKLHLYFH